MYKWGFKINHVQTHTCEDRKEEEIQLAKHIKERCLFIALQPVEDVLKHYVWIEDTGFHGKRYDPNTEAWVDKTREEVLEEIK
jgi:hypothetical protein